VTSAPMLSFLLSVWIGLKDSLVHFYLVLARSFGLWRHFSCCMPYLIIYCSQAIFDCLDQCQSFWTLWIALAGDYQPQTNQPSNLAGKKSWLRKKERKKDYANKVTPVCVK